MGPIFDHRQLVVTSKHSSNKFSLNHREHRDHGEKIKNPSVRSVFSSVAGGKIQCDYMRTVLPLCAKRIRKRLPGTALVYATEGQRRLDCKINLKKLIQPQRAQRTQRMKIFFNKLLCAALWSARDPAPLWYATQWRGGLHWKLTANNNDNLNLPPENPSFAPQNSKAQPVLRTPKASPTSNPAPLLLPKICV